MGHSIIILLVALLAIGIFLIIFARVSKSHYYRLRGKHIEQDAIKSLKLPTNFIVESNKPVPTCGDADIYVYDPSKRKAWVIEIKSYEGAKKPSFLSFTKDEIVRPNGNKFSRNAIEQVLRVGEKLNAAPILWLPKAPSKRKFKTKSGVVVFQGSAKKLRKYFNNIR